MSRKVYLNKNWRFNPSFNDGFIYAPMKEGAVAQLPHVVQELPFSYYDPAAVTSEVCYQKSFIPNEAWKDSHIYLCLERVAYSFTLYFNGEMILRHDEYNAACKADLTGLMRFGAENLAVLKVFPEKGSVLPYPGGITGDVYLLIEDEICLKEVKVIPRIEQIHTAGKSAEEIADLRVMANLTTTVVLSDPGTEIMDTGRLSVTQYLNGKKIFGAPLRNDTFQTQLYKAALWDPLSPSVYVITTELCLDGKALDSISHRIGFRDGSDRKEVFFLNGRKLSGNAFRCPLFLPYTGLAIPERTERERVWLIKEELNFSAVIFDDILPSHDFLDACDDMGLPVFLNLISGEENNANGQEEKEVILPPVADEYMHHPCIMSWGEKHSYLHEFSPEKICDNFLNKNAAFFTAAGASDASGKKTGIMEILKNNMSLGKKEDDPKEHFITKTFTDTEAGFISKTGLSVNPLSKKALHVLLSANELSEKHSYDMTMVRLFMTDEKGEVLPDAFDAIRLEAEGAVEVYGPSLFSLNAGSGGFFIRSAGHTGEGAVTVNSTENRPVRITFKVE